MTTPSQTETARPLDGAMENILDDGQRPGWWRHFAGHEDTECVIRPMHLASLLDRAARTHRNRLAIRFQNFQMTYSRLHEAAERFAEALRLRGVKPGQRVAVMLPNIPQTVIAFWGIMKAGAVAVMTNPLYMEKELLHHFNDAGAEVLVTLDLLWAKLEPLRDRLPLRLTVVTNISDGLAFPLNWLYRIKARRQGQQGGIFQKERAIDASNVMLICPKCGKATRVAHRKEEITREDGTKKTKTVRVCKRCKADID